MATKRWSPVPLEDEVTLISPEGLQYLLLNDLVHTMLDVSVECSDRFEILFTEAEKLRASFVWIFFASDVSVTRWHTGKITMPELAAPNYHRFWKALDDWCGKVGVADPRIGQIGINIIIHSMGIPFGRTFILSEHLLLSYSKVQSDGLSMGRFVGPPVKPLELPEFEPLFMTEEWYIGLCKSTIEEYMMEKLTPYIANGFKYIEERREGGKHMRLLAEYLRLGVGVNELSRILTRDGLVDANGMLRLKGFSKGNISTALTQLCKDMGINFPPSQRMERSSRNADLIFGNSVKCDDRTIGVFDHKPYNFYKKICVSMNLASDHLY